MVKTQVVVCCDKCEIPFKDTDMVNGFVRFTEYPSYSLGCFMDDISSNEYYFCDDCLDQIKNKANIDIINYFSDSIRNATDFNNIKISMFIPYISEYYEIKKIRFNDPGYMYFLINVEGENCLIKASLNEVKDNIVFTGLTEIIERIFNRFDRDTLSNLRLKYKNKLTEKKQAARYTESIACSASALDIKSNDCTISIQG